MVSDKYITVGRCEIYFPQIWVGGAREKVEFYVIQKLKSEYTFPYAYAISGESWSKDILNAKQKNR